MQYKAAFLALLPLILAIPLPPASQLVGDATNRLAGTDTSVGGVHVPGKVAGVNLANPTKRGPPTEGSGSLGVVDPNGHSVGYGDLAGHTDGTTDGSGDMGIGETSNGGDIVSGSADGSTVGSDALAGQNKRGTPTDGSGNLGVVDPNGANVFNGDLAGHTDGTTDGSGDMGIGETSNGGDIISGGAEGSTLGSDALGANRRDQVGDGVATVKETATGETTGTNLDPNALSATAGNTNANVDGTTDGSPIVDANAAGQNVGTSVDGVNGGSPSVGATAAGHTVHIPRDNFAAVNAGDAIINAPVDVEN